MSKPLRPANADGVCCHRIGGCFRSKLTCAPTVVPTDTAGTQAKRFDTAPASLTVHVLRCRWVDASAVVPVRVDEADAVAAIPASPVRLRLKPGSQHLTAEGEGHALDKLAGSIRSLGHALQRASGAGGRGQVPGP